MSYQWFKTNFPGVRYRKHKTRKHGVGPDKYFSIYYRLSGKQKEEGIGWASHGFSAKKASIILNELKKNHLTGEGEQTLSEKRAVEKEKREDAKREKKRLEKENVSFKQYFDEVYFPVAKTSKKAESSRKEKEHFTNWLSPVLADRPLKQIKPLHLERVKRNMVEAGKSPRTIQYVLATFRQTWNMARRDGILSEESPSKQVKVPKIDNRRLRFLTHDEADRLLDCLKGRSTQIYNISLLSLHTGMRVGEIFNLTWGHVDIDHGIIRIVDAKGGKNRTAYMTENVKSMFESLVSGGHDDLVFTDTIGEKIVKISNTFERTIKDLGLNNGVTDKRMRVVFHTLRHTFASWLVESGTGLYTVKELMGHSTLAMTERYSHLGENTLQRAIDGLQDKINDARQGNVIKIRGKNGGLASV